MLDTEYVIAHRSRMDRAEGRPSDRAGIRCDSPAEVDRVYAGLLDAGGAGTAGRGTRFWGQRYAQVTDPDGNVVDLYAAR